MKFLLKAYFGGCWCTGLFIMQFILGFVMIVYYTGGGQGTRFMSQMVGLFGMIFFLHMILFVVNYLKD